MWQRSNTFALSFIFRNRVGVGPTGRRLERSSSLPRLGYGKTDISRRELFSIWKKFSNLFATDWLSLWFIRARERINLWASSTVWCLLVNRFLASTTNFSLILKTVNNIKITNSFSTSFRKAAEELTCLVGRKLVSYYAFARILVGAVSPLSAIAYTRLSKYWSWFVKILLVIVPPILVASLWKPTPGIQSSLTQF